MVASELRIIRLNRTLWWANPLVGLAGAFCALQIQHNVWWALPALLALVSLVYLCIVLNLVQEERYRRCEATLAYFRSIDREDRS